MGDGVSDLVIRGEAGEEAERDYILARVRYASDRVWKIHKHSVSYLQLWRTIRVMEADGEIEVTSQRDWYHIRRLA